MNQTTHFADEQPSAATLDDLIEEITEHLQAGRPVDIEAYAKQHPQHAQRLRQLYPTLEIMAKLNDLADEDLGLADLGDSKRLLGDFCILREVARGGMGVVYEAQQLSLRRRVALKVLPLAGALHPRQLQRFENEARAAAGLHHSNIVPVFAVGCERGVHYYAMQFIEGRSLAEVIGDLRRRYRPAQAGAALAAVAETVAVPGEQNADRDRPAGSGAADGEGVRKTSDSQESQPLAGLSTDASPHSKQWCRAVAEIAVQVAEALEHAHEVGVTHRDIKPANLLVDGHGRVWVADFGLAQIESDSRMTVSGDVLGTLRYMSPEQAQGLRETDHRADLYSLGATLYELLALRAPFESGSRAGLLQQILEAPPPSLRKFNKGVPAELETMILKTLEKAPQDRYRSAKELADDLGRFLRDEPIRARRPTLWQRVLRWRRRYKRESWVGIAALAVVCLVTAAFFYTSARSRAARHQTIREKSSEALLEAAGLQGQAEQAQDDVGKWAAALSAAKRARALLPDDLPDAPLRQRALTAVTELEREQKGAQARADQAALDKSMKGELERIRLEEFKISLSPENASIIVASSAAAEDYVTAFQGYGLDVFQMPVESAVFRIRSSSIRTELTAAIDHWNFVLVFPEDDARRKRIRAIALAIDPDDKWRSELYHALEQKNGILARRIAHSPEAALQSAENIIMLARLLWETDQRELAVTVLRHAQQRFPGDLWSNCELAGAIERSPEPDWNEVIRFFTAAVAIRPTNALAFSNLASVFFRVERHDEAIAACREAIRLQPAFAPAYSNLGNSLAEIGQLEEAIAALRKAVRLMPKEAAMHSSLGAALQDKRQLDEAIAHFNEAIRLRPNLAQAHYGLGKALKDKHRPDEAIAAYREAIRLRQDFPEAYNNLGVALQEKGQLDDAISAYHEVIRLKPDHAGAHNNLGAALLKKGQLKGAIAAFREAIRLNPDFADAHVNFGSALAAKGELEEAIAAVREAIRLKPNSAVMYFNLGILAQKAGQIDDAIAAYREAIRLQPDFAFAHNHLGGALQHKGQLDDAIAAFKEAIRLNPDYAKAYCNLKNPLLQKGLFQEALDAVRRGHELGSSNPQWPYPSAQWVEKCARLVELNHNLAAVLSGEAALESIDERLEYAEFCQMYKKQYASAVRLYEDAFQQKPRLLAQFNRYCYNAACAAALAGTGQGADAGELDKVRRAGHRQKALSWLRHHLEAVKKIALSDQNRPELTKAVTHWAKDPDLAGVRDAESLEKLPQAERQSWQMFWAEVGKVLPALQQKLEPSKTLK